MLEMWTWILYLTRFLGLLSFCHGAQQDGGSAYHFTSGCSAVVPFEVTKNIIFFQIHVKGSSRALWFNLDSGAGSSYMDTEVAKSLGLRTVGSGTVNGAGFGDVPVEYVDLVTFELPGLESGGHRINTTDFKSLNEQFGRAENGLLGYDFLSRYVVGLRRAENDRLRSIEFQVHRFRRRLVSPPITACCSANPDDQRKIGGEVLRRFTVIFDYPHQRIILEPNRNFPEPFPDA
jgi:hypothetical protein